jgi:hypothetical protein
MGALPSPPSSRLEAVLRAGQQARSTGMDFAVAHRRAQASRAKAGASLDAGADDLLDKKAKVLQQEAAEQTKRAEELQDQYAQRQKLEKKQREANQQRIDNAIDQEAERQAIKKELDTAKRAYRGVMGLADEANDDIEDAGYEYNMVTGYNSVKLLSPTEATTFMEKLQVINLALTKVQTIKNLPEIDKLQATDRIEYNKENIGKLKAYIPEIQDALNREYEMGRVPAAEQEALRAETMAREEEMAKQALAKQETELSALRAKFRARQLEFEEQAAAAALVEQKALEQDRKRSQEDQKALERERRANRNRIEDLQGELEVAKREAAVASTNASAQASKTEADLRRSLRDMQAKLRMVEAQAYAAQQAATECNSILDNKTKVDASALDVAEQKYQSLQMQVEDKTEAYKMTLQSAENAKETLEVLEAQLVQDKNHALVLYTTYAAWERDHMPNPFGPGQRIKQQQDIAAAKKQVEELSDQVRAAEKKFDALDRAAVQAYTEQQVAVGVLNAAKKRVNMLKDALNVVVGKPV